MRRAITVSSLAVAVVLALMTVSLRAGEAPVVTSEILAKVAQMLADRPGDYAGSDVCELCHNNSFWDFKYDTWQATLHAQAIRDPDESPGVVPDNDFKMGLDLSTDPDFSQYGANAPVLSYDGADPAHPTDGTSGYRVTIGAITYTVNRTHGGYWKQRFQTQIGNSFYYLPIQYNKKTADWVVFHGGDWYDGSNPLFTDPATLADDIDKTDSFERKCAACHMVGLELTFDEGTSEYVASFRELNIGCETCHGPGAPPTHILYGLSGKGLDPSILDADRGNEVCGQCHNRGQGALAVGGNTLGYPWGVEGGFTPGDVLANFFVAVNPADDPNRFWPDGEHSKSHRQQYLDFYQSPKPTHQVVCWECHDPHGSANKHDIVESIEEDGVIIPTENDNNTLCLACHAGDHPFEALTKEMIADYEGNLEAIAAVVSAHTKHPYDPENENGTGGSSRCSKCHMPKVAKSAVAYDIHAHTFEAIPGQKTLETQADGGMPNACAVSCHRNATQANLPNFGVEDPTLTAWNEPSDTAVAVIVQGNQDQWAVDTSRYAGVGYCDNCHGQVSAYAGDQWMHWKDSKHAEAYDDIPANQDDPECLRCHTTGWDTLAPNGGFDDFFNAGDETGIQRTKSVQCESCHEAGSRHPIPEFGTVEVNYGADQCGDCHQGADQPNFEEWAQSGHAISLAAGGGTVAQDPECARCHVAQSAIQHFEGEEVTLPDEPEPISCPACHDPHSPETAHQLRVAVEEMCVQCHTHEGAQPGETPDYSQAEMLEGTGGYEYPGEVYGNSPHTFVVTEKCVVCHMWTRESVGEGSAAITGHTFEPRFEACQAEGCHPGLETFDRNGVQTEIDSLLNVLENALAAVEDSTTEDFINALFNYEFVTNDGSKGVHNTAYAKKLLWDSIESLTGEAPVARYAGVEYCNNCHGGESSVAGTQYTQWLGTRHAVAYDAEGRADQPYWVDPCNWCHTAGHDPEVDNGGFDEAVTAADTLRLKNVQCEACHGPGSLHPGEFAEVSLGLETDVCAQCHYLANLQWSESEHEVQAITCAVCHDPHDASVSGSQLRDAAREICQTCHNAEGAEPGDTPHHPQDEMLEGVGGYEYPDQTYASSAHTVVVPEKCVTCHMYSEEFTSSFFSVELSDHTFLPRLEACQECHPGLDTFDKDGVQTEIEDLLTALGDALEAASPEDSLTDSFKYALFNYEFVLHDGSRGVHNTTYARKLLEDALADFAPELVGLVGDVNDDGGINVFDVVGAVNIVLTIEEPTWDKVYRADCNRDGGVNIMDVLGIANVTLGTGACPPATAPKGTYGVATVGASEMVVRSSRHFELPLFVSTDVDLAGAQFMVRYDPVELTPETPQVTPRTAGMTVSSKAENGTLVIALYSTDGSTVPSGTGSVVTVPFRVNEPSAQFELSLDEVILAANCAETITAEVRPIVLRATDLLPDVYALHQNYPNPFNPETEIAYAIPTAGMVKLTVYNVLGQVVTVLVNKTQEPGYYAVRWDGRNDAGNDVVSGVYLYRLEAGSFVSTKKMILVK